MEKGQKIRKLIRCFLFILIFCFLLYGLNGLLAEKWWYPMFKESPTYQYRELYETDLSDLQAVFLGTSHMEMAVDPMRIYKEKGFATFNMASSVQPIEGSYYALEEVFRLSSPEYVFLDVGKLFTTSSDSYHRLILENMQWGLPKLKYIRKWAMLKEDKSIERLISAFFPIVEYHDRWEKLTEQDFINEAGKRDYYRKGHYSRQAIANTDLYSLERINREAASIEQYHTDIQNAAFENGEKSVIAGISDSLYNLEISAEDQEMILKMRNLCRKHHAKLIFVKIPCVRLAQKYPGAWTKTKSDVMKDFSEKIGVEFIDLLYDYDLGVDWEQDTWDNGMHLNYTGTIKATRFFEEYLKKAGLNSISCAAYEEDLITYDKICRVAELEMIRGFDEYFQTIQDLKDVTVLIAVRDDMRKRLSQEDIDIIKKFGIQTRIEELRYSDAFAAVIDNGNVVYEESSNGNIHHEGSLSDGTPYQMNSSGFLVKNVSNIFIDGKDYSCNKRGLNIVVYDHESRLVIDSCTFDTWASDKPQATRTYSGLDLLFRDYEEWCMRQSYLQKQQ